MFKNLSSGGRFAALALLAIAGIVAYFSLRDNATHGDGRAGLAFAGVVAAGAVAVALYDARQNTKRLARKRDSERTW